VTRSSLSFALAALAAVAPAQIPAHATVLNPSGWGIGKALVGVAGDTVHAITFPGPAATGGGSLVGQARSRDGGSTWPIRERFFGAEHAVHAFAVDGERLLVLGQHQYAGLRVLRSDDGGDTWAPPVYVSPSQVSQLRAAAMHVDGDRVVVVWIDNRSTAEVFANVSTDGGVTWLPTDQRLDLGIAPFGADRLGIAAGNGVLHVAWTKLPLPTAQPTWYQRSTDGGATWQSAAQTLFAQGFTDLAASGSTVLATGQQQGAFVRSIDAGASWTPVAGVGIAQLQTVAIAGNVAVAVGTPMLPPQPTFLVNTSTDGGASWRPAPLTLPTFVWSLITTAAVDGPQVLVHFREVQGATSLTIQSNDAGGTWRSWSGPSNRGLAPTPARAIALTSVGATWYGYVAAGHTRRGSGTAGSGGHVPTLAAAALPTLGGTTVLHVENALGGTLGLLGLSFANAAPTPLGSTTLWLQGSVAAAPFVTSGASGQPGAGTWQLPLVVPDTPSLVGQHFTTQAFVLDAGALDGFAATNARESWMR